MKSVNLNFLEPSGPLQACNGTDLLLSSLFSSVLNDHHQGALSVPNQSYIDVKKLGKIKSLHKLGDVAARALCALHATHVPLYDILPHHLIYTTT